MNFEDVSIDLFRDVEMYRLIIVLYVCKTKPAAVILFRVRERETVIYVVLVSLTQKKRSKPILIGFRLKTNRLIIS